METNRNKRRGFMKGKLMPFYRAGKPSAVAAAAHYVTGNNKMMKPSHHSLSSPSTLGFLVHQDYVVSQPSKANKVSFLLPEQFESHYGVAGDEAVDSKAATYISSVQERFRLEGIKGQDYIRS